MANDFAAPLTLFFDPSTTPIAPTVTRRRPPNLDAVVTLVEAQLRVQPLLLNPGDWCDVRFLLNGALPHFHPTARTVGAPNPQPILAPILPAGPFVASIESGAVLLRLLRSFATQVHVAAAATLSLGVGGNIGGLRARRMSLRRYPWGREREQPGCWAPAGSSTSSWRSGSSAGDARTRSLRQGSAWSVRPDRGEVRSAPGEAVPASKPLHYGLIRRRPATVACTPCLRQEPLDRGKRESP